MADVAAAALLGLSLGNVWICALVVFALRTAERSACGGYLVGRVVGVVGFAIAFWLIGGLWKPSHQAVNIMSAAMMLLFVAYFYAKHRLGWKLLHRSGDGGDHRHHHHHDLDPAEADHDNCDHDCSSCPVSADAELHKYCSDCDDERSCAAEEPQVAALTRSARRKWGRGPEGEDLTGFFSGFALGGLRGSAMCGRMVVLLPLVMTGTLGHAVLVGTAFAVTSTIYPLIGMVIGDVILRAVPHRKRIFDFSAVVLVLIAGLYFYRGLTV